MPPDVYTTGKIGTICGVTPATVKKWIRDGLLIAYRMPGQGRWPGQWRVTRINLRRFMTDNGIPTIDLAHAFRNCFP